ncbi:hypothetical protein ACFLWZ_00880 [Chloroflexota bacterium]
MYFGVLKRLEWVEVTSETEPSAIQDNYPPAPERTYYRLTKKGIEAGDDLWSNPLFTLYPEIGPSHMKRAELTTLAFSSHYTAMFTITYPNQ